MADVKSKRYAGVYHRVLEDKSKTFYIMYKNPITNKKQRLKIGNTKEGFNEAYAFNKRSEILSRLRLGEDTNIPILLKKQSKETLNELSKIYFKHKKDTKGLTRSLKDRQSKYNLHFSNDLGALPIQAINKNEVMKMQKRLIGLGYSNATINNVLDLGKTIINHAIKSEIYKGLNPFYGLEALKVDNQRIRYLSSEEIEQLKEAVKKDDILYLFVCIALTTGARLESILHLRKKDVDFNINALNIQDLKNKCHYVGALTKEAKSLILKRIEGLNDDDFIISFYGGKQTETKQIQRRLKPILDNLFNQNLDTKDTRNRVVIHTLRHTFASHLAINGTPLYTIQKLMSHKDIKQTMRYAKLSPESGINAVLKVFD